jgi:hypothetical protein
VSALVTLRRRTAETTLPEIAVEVALPPSEVGLWKVEMGPESRVLRGVRVGGTATAVGRLGAGQVAVRAIVQLTSADLASRVSRKPVVLMGLPPGVGPLDEAMAVDLVITPVVGP